MTKPKKLYVIDEEAGVLDEVQGWFLAPTTRAGSILQRCASSSTACTAIATIRRNAHAKAGTRPTTMRLTVIRRPSPGPSAPSCSMYLPRRRRCLSRPRNHANPLDVYRRPSAKPKQADPAGTTAPSAAGRALTSRPRSRLRGGPRARETRAMHDQHPYASLFTHRVT